MIVASLRMCRHRRDLKLAAVADDQVCAAPADDLDGECRRAVLSDEIEDNVGAPAAGRLEDGFRGSVDVEGHIGARHRGRTPRAR